MTNGLPKTLQNFARKLVIYLKEYGQIGLKWSWKVFKSWRYALQKGFAKRRFDKMLKHFGSEVYVVFVKEGKSDWMETASIREKIEMLKLTEANVNHFDRLREDLERHFELQKLQIKKNAEASRRALPDLGGSKEETS
ncbi:MAG: hypothetical protein N2260_01185 [Syntrophobacterales bacterium]|nr:hypothetical protein [Syntrophobacterales bacterium]